MLQLWVNLPKKLKMTPPKYQSIKKEDIPNIKLTDEINIRLIAGNFLNKSGPAKTFTKINIMDFYGKNKSQISLKIEEKINTILVILSGNIQVDSKSYKDKSVIVFDQLGTNLSFKTSKNFKALLLTGEPIDEPLVAHGPFVMNTEQEIDQAIKDYQNGKMGNLL